MHTLARYLFREIAGHVIAITGLLFAIQASFVFSKVLFRAASNEFSQAFVWGMLGLTALQNLQELVPVSLFLSIMLALGRLYQDSEIAAMQACGYGTRSWLRPVMAIAGFMAVMLAVLAFWIAPRAKSQAQELVLHATRQARFASLEPQRFRTFANNVVFYAERVDDNGMLHNVFIQRSISKGTNSKVQPAQPASGGVTDNERMDFIEVTVADSAEQLGAGEAEQTFVLHNGRTYQGVPGQAVFRVTTFSESRIPVRLPNMTAGSTRTDAKPFSDVLLSSELADRAELQARLSIPLMILVLALLAVPLSKLNPRRGRYANLGLGLLVFFIYLLAVRTATSWIEQQKVSVALGVWWVHALAALTAMILIFKQDPPDWLLRRRLPSIARVS
jgi:lipopolysaccharide export system permease protein